jgi:hypothetical protein
VTGIDVTPAVANHPTRAEVNLERVRGLKQHAGCRLPTLAGLAVRFTPVVADLNHVDRRQMTKERCMHSFDDRLLLGPATDIRLVRYHDQLVSGCLELRARIDHAIKQTKFRKVMRRIGPAVANDRQVQRAVAIQKDCMARSQEAEVSVKAYSRFPTCDVARWSEHHSNLRINCDTFPFGLVDLKRGVRNPQVPDHGLKGF